MKKDPKFFSNLNFDEANAPSRGFLKFISSIIEKAPAGVLLEKTREQLSLLGVIASKRFEKHFMAVAVLSILSATALITYHTLVISFYEYSRIETVMAYVLLVCEVFFAVNGIGYAFWIYQARNYKSRYDQYFGEESTSSVACLLPVCGEPVDVIRETLASICAMQYKNKQVYVLDDSSKKEHKRMIADLAKAYGATLVTRKDRNDYKAGNLNNALKKIKTDYIACFDADQRPSSSFLKDLIPSLDKDPKLAIVQTPQDYEDSLSRIARTAAMQNSLFYEYIAESKDLTGSVFCCGTNFVMRLAALRDIGGFETYSITEDFATTLKLHSHGWKTSFNNRRYGLGLAPETMAEYFKQHSRWATGTLQVLSKAIKLLITNPRAMTVKQWFEYWLSCSFYLTGIFNFYFLLLPPAFAFFGITLVKGNPWAYLAIFFSVFFSFWTFFLYTSVKRGYPAGHLILVCARLEMCKFHIYSKAFFSAFSGRRPSFQVTDKGATTQVPWSFLWVPLAVFFLNAASALVGLYRLGVSFQAYLVINTVWSIYNAWQLSALIQYNASFKHSYIKYFNLFRVGQTEASAAASVGESGGE